MPVYFLAPLNGKEGHTDWRASDILPMAVWVRADTTDQARARVQLAAIKAFTSLPGEVIPHSPWVQPEITSCIQDESRDPGEGVVLCEDGETITI